MQDLEKTEEERAQLRQESIDLKAQVEELKEALLLLRGESSMSKRSSRSRRKPCSESRVDKKWPKELPDIPE